VTGAGDIVWCSETQESDLFEAMLAGLGQCGIITRAKLDMVPAKQMARTYHLEYLDTATFFKDLRTLLDRGELNGVFNICFPFGTSLTYQINAVIYFDPSNPPDDSFLLRGLSVPPELALPLDQNYVDAVTFPDTALEFSHADWIAQYGASWPQFLQRKQKFDPENILTPGPGIF
jgi:cytokinin dehydrogenase